MGDVELCQHRCHIFAPSRKRRENTVCHSHTLPLTMRLVRFLYMMRCPQSRQRTGSRGLISLIVAHSGRCKHRGQTDRVSATSQHNTVPGGCRAGHVATLSPPFLSSPRPSCQIHTSADVLHRSSGAPTQAAVGASATRAALIAHTRAGCGGGCGCGGCGRRGFLAVLVAGGCASQR